MQDTRHASWMRRHAASVLISLHMRARAGLRAMPDMYEAYVRGLYSSSTRNHFCLMRKSASCSNYRALRQSECGGAFTLLPR